MIDFEVIRLQPGNAVAVPPELFAAQIKPIRCWILPYGAIDNKPSFCFEHVGPHGEVYIAQISLRMLANAFKAADEMKILSEQ